MVWLGAVLAFVVGRLLGVRRAHVVASMTQAGVPAPEATATAMYRSLGAGLVELGWMAFGPRRPLTGWVRIAPEVLEAARGSGQGAVIATAHTGNWDLLACAAAEHLPLTVVTKRLSIALFDRLWQGARRRRGVRLVGAGQAARAARKVLGSGGVVAMLVDQAPERARATTVTEFLGRPARVDLAPALIAERARVPLVAVFARRMPDGTHVAELAGVIEPAARPSREHAAWAMRQVTDWLDAFVRRHPEQWLWMHRRWKDAPRSEPIAARGASPPPSRWISEGLEG